MMKKIVALCLIIAVAFTFTPFAGITATDASAAAKKKQGIVKIKDKYYLFNTAGKKIQMTKKIKGVMYYI
ncbi:MAG: hypothetical protein IJ132_04155, partial [Firmicutes bacterium]|nr:hypothetical protein [Bacillota bacterium]